ncbi:hypothetical protein CTH_2281 [Carboxydocella thermautotrophica]|nr:hypothetical protein CTH_2281 [Carboxydocella thermautotrophica]
MAKKSPWSNGDSKPNKDRIAKEHKSKLRKFNDLFANPLRVVDIKLGVLVSREPAPAYFRSYTPEEWELVERIRRLEEEKIQLQIKQAWEERKARLGYGQKVKQRRAG